MHIHSLFIWQLHIHSHHLVLMVDIGSYLQQSLDCLGVSLLSSYPQRNSASLYETREQSLLVEIIAVEHTQRERERQTQRSEHKECSIHNMYTKTVCTHEGRIQDFVREGTCPFSRCLRMRKRAERVRYAVPF